MPQLNGTVQGAPPNKKGFDVDAKIDSATAKKFKNQGYDFCIRYISLTTQNADIDLDHQEASAILDAGLALMPVQHVLNPGWTPSAALGKEYGENAKNNASTVGFPKGVNVWCDLEGVNPSATAQSVIDYCNAWFDAVSAGGYVPGLYVGYDAIVDADQLSQLKFQHFWKSFSTVPAVTGRGYQMIQLQETTVNEFQIDLDTTRNDDQGGQVQWLVKGSPVVYPNRNVDVNNSWQNWKIEPGQSGYNLIVNKLSGAALDGGADSGNKVYPNRNVDVNNSWQNWKIEPGQSGYNLIVNKLSSAALDGGADSGTRVYPNRNVDVNNSWQNWKIEPGQSGYNLIVNKLSGAALDGGGN